MHLNQGCSKFDEMPKSPKNGIFSLFGQSEQGWLGVEECQNVHLNQMLQEI